jgi:putative transcriptional regulator
MTIRHHPSDLLLTAFSAGTLDQGRHAVVAAHLQQCRHCRSWTRSMEEVGGTILDSLTPSVVSDDALSRIQARLDLPSSPVQANPVPADGLSGIPGLPAYIRQYPAGHWTWIAPGLHLRRIHFPDGGKTRSFLLRSRPGSRLMRHGHTGEELTCVLAGSFMNHGDRYGPGDFDFGEPNIEHEIVIGSEEPCLSLVALQGRLQLSGLFGRLIQSFITI